MIIHTKRKKCGAMFYGRKKRSNGTYINKSSGRDAWTAIENGSASGPVKFQESGVDKLRRKLLSKKNYGESTASRLLKSAGLEFIRERPFFFDKQMFFMDFLVKMPGGYPVALEIDGSIHGLAEVIERDECKDLAYANMKWINGAVRIKGTQISKMTAKELVELLESSVRGKITRSA